MSTIEIIGPLWPNLGLEIQLPGEGCALSDSAAKELQHRLIQNRVLLLRDFPADAEHQIAITRALGQAVSHPGLRTLHAPVQLRIEDDQHLNPFNGVWHSDTSWSDDPSDVTLLYALNAGENCAMTQFADMARSYDNLSALQLSNFLPWHVYHHVARARGLRAVGAIQSPDQTLAVRLRMLRVWLSESRSSWRRDDPRKSSSATPVPSDQHVRGARHRLINRCPFSGRRYICLGEHAWRIAELPMLSGIREISRLNSQLTLEVVAHRWRAGDLLIFDNRTLLHRRNPMQTLSQSDPVKFERRIRRTMAWLAAPRIH